MKTIYRLLVLLIFILPLSIQAQNFNGGFHLGIAASQISGDQLSGFNKPGIFGGAFANYYFKESLAAQLEINYIEKGSAKYAKPNKGDYVTYKLKLNYIEVPVLLKWDFNASMALEGGLAFGVLIKDSEEDRYGQIPVSAGYPEFRKTDLSALIGLYYGFNEKLSAHLRMSNSILAVRDHRGGGTYRLNKGQYHSVLLLGLRYQF